MNLDSFSELRQEQVLIDIVHSEFLEDSAEVSLINEFVLFALLL